jgi:hypothetical protein
MIGCARRNLKKTKARASKAGTASIQKSGNADAIKQGETLTEAIKRPRSEGSAPTETARPPKRLRDSSRPGTYKDKLTNIKIALFGGDIS